MTYNPGMPIGDTNRIPVAGAAVHAEPAIRSGSIAVGGTAQNLMAANAARVGWAIQNQSSQDLYVRNKGSAGSTQATLDQNSLRIAPGAHYVADYVSANALSIIGATSGQAFWSREW